MPSIKTTARSRALPLAALAAILALLVWTAQTDAAEVAPPTGEAETIAISFAPPAGLPAPAQQVTCTWEPQTPREIGRSAATDDGGDWVHYSQQIQRTCTDGVDRSYSRSYWSRDGG